MNATKLDGFSTGDEAQKTREKREGNKVSRRDQGGGGSGGAGRSIWG